jgi:DNA repair exonuclease SbcCD ATPase subunit
MMNLLTLHFDIWTNILVWSQLKESFSLRRTCKELFNIVEKNAETRITAYKTVYGTLSAFNSLVWAQLKAIKTTDRLVEEFEYECDFAESKNDFIQIILQTLIITGPEFEYSIIWKNLNVQTKMPEELKLVTKIVVQKINNVDKKMNKLMKKIKKVNEKGQENENLITLTARKLERLKEEDKRIKQEKEKLEKLKEDDKRIKQEKEKLEQQIDTVKKQQCRRYGIEFCQQ